MSKAVIYIASREGSRPGPIARDCAWEHFVSTGGMCGSPALAAEIANRGLQHGFTVTVQDNKDGTVTLKRNVPLA